MELHKVVNGKKVSITEEEYNAIHAAENIWNKDSHTAEVEAAVDNLVKNQLNDLWYASLGDLAATALNTKARWNEEAILVNEWQARCYELLEDYKKMVTEETALTVEAFLSNLPELEV